MESLKNPFRGSGIDHADLTAMPWPASDAAPVRALLARCPVAAKTPLTAAPALARMAGIAELWIKDERTRQEVRHF